MIISKDKKYQTVGGFEVRIYHIDETHESYNAVHGALCDSDKGWYPSGWSLKGQYYVSSSSDYDLVEVPQTIEIKGWINFYRDDKTQEIFSSEILATHFEATKDQNRRIYEKYTLLHTQLIEITVKEPKKDEKCCNSCPVEE